MHHRAPDAAELLDGNLSVTVMLRTSLFPYNRARLRNTTPSPRPFFELLAETFRAYSVEMPWRLPTLAECVQSEALAHAGTPPSRGVPPPAVSSDTQPVSAKRPRRAR